VDFTHKANNVHSPVHLASLSACPGKIYLAAAHMLVVLLCCIFPSVLADYTSFGRAESSWDSAASGRNADAFSENIARTRPDSNMFAAESVGRGGASADDDNHKGRSDDCDRSARTLC
jgi:hypothetical protein